MWVWQLKWSRSQSFTVVYITISRQETISSTLKQVEVKVFEVFRIAKIFKLLTWSQRCEKWINYFLVFVAEKSKGTLRINSCTVKKWTYFSAYSGVINKYNCNPKHCTCIHDHIKSFRTQKIALWLLLCPNWFTLVDRRGNRSSFVQVHVFVGSAILHVTFPDWGYNNTRGHWRNALDVLCLIIFWLSKFTNQS